MIGVWRASLQVLTARLEIVAAVLSERAKRYAERQLYIGYEQGLRDGLAGAEHAKQWLASKSPRQPYPNE